MIIFDSKTKIFYLNTKSTTYAFGVLEDTVLVHLYWGKRLKNSIPAEWPQDYEVWTNDNRLVYYKSRGARDLGKYSTHDLPLEFDTFGSADMRYPTFHALHKDGSRITKLKYKDFKIVAGKPGLEGLPATYCEDGDKVETLVIHLEDKLKKIDVYLQYSVFEDYDVITRSNKIVNRGENIFVTSALSTTVDFIGNDSMDIIHLDGAWGRERSVVRNKILTGDQHIESRVGASSSDRNPFIAVCNSSVTETQGDVYGFSLVYSGNFIAGVDQTPFYNSRVYIGINPFDFRYKLETNEHFQTPETVLVYSPNGLNEMSQIYHKLYRTRLCRGKYRDEERFVVLNHWEAYRFDFDEEKLLEMARKGAEIGVDLFVLDDGWFGKRDNDRSSLGDWKVNQNKLPNGLDGLVKRINDMGLRFGIWFEPEMISPVSELYDKHPDWALHVQGRESSQYRFQLVLDLSRKDVCDYVIKSVSDILNSANIEYVKWDMNRYMSEVGSALLPLDRQGEVMHRYMLGLYYIMETLVTRYPNVLFESCASGGGRFDPGMLYYMPQVWTSDCSDAVSRLSIQYGTSIVYPYSTMAAHVSAVPNHQMKRTTPFEMRCNVAMAGQFGFELDLNNCTMDELDAARKSIIKYRKLGPVFHKGTCYRICSPFETDLSVVEFVSEDKNTVICCINSKFAIANAERIHIRLQGLSDENEYILEENGRVYGGDYLMNYGIPFCNKVEQQSVILIFTKTISSYQRHNRNHIQEGQHDN